MLGNNGIAYKITLLKQEKIKLCLKLQSARIPSVGILIAVISKSVSA